MGRRILVAWELGGNLGHVTPLLAVARELRERGHRVVFALRDPSHAGLLARQRFSFLPAPAAPRVRRPGAYRSYAEMLAGEVFPSAKAAHAMALAWRAIFRAVRPEVLVADHAPAALLAARGTALRTVACGSPFSIPVAGRPLPRFARQAAGAAEHEAQLLARLNRVLGALRGPALAGASDLYRTDAVAVKWLPQLDPFGPRPRPHYVGPLLADAGDAEPAWPDGRGPRLLTYLRPGAYLPPLLDAMRDAGASVLGYVPRAGAELAQAARERGVHLSPALLKMSALLPQCDAVVCHGGNLSAAAALAGKPLLLFPVYVEQHLTAARAVEAGIAVVPARAGANAPQATIEALASGGALAQAAGALAKRQDAALRSAVASVVRQVEGTAEKARAA